MNSTTTVTDWCDGYNLSNASVEPLITLHIPSTSEITTPLETHSDGIQCEFLLMGTTCDEITHPEIFGDQIVIDGEPVQSPSNEYSSPVLRRDSFLPVQTENDTTSCECTNGVTCATCLYGNNLGPPPKKKKKLVKEKKFYDSSSPSTSSTLDNYFSSNENWPCAYCERHFKLKASLYKHYRTLHPNHDCDKCINDEAEKPEKLETRKKRVYKRRKPSWEQIEANLKAKFDIKECKVLVKCLTEAKVLELTTPKPLPREMDFPRMYKNEKKNFVPEKNDETSVGSDVLIVNDILTQEVVIEEVAESVMSTNDTKVTKLPDEETCKDLFECDTCGVGFDHRLMLLQHQRIAHTENCGVPKLRCEKCGQDFTQLTKYQNHVETCNEAKNINSRNLFEELTNYRSFERHVSSPKISKSSFIKDDNVDEDSIIKLAEHQLLNSPTSSQSSGATVAYGGMVESRDAVAIVKKLQSRKLNFGSRSTQKQPIAVPVLNLNKNSPFTTASRKRKSVSHSPVGRKSRKPNRGLLFHYLKGEDSSADETPVKKRQKKIDIDYEPPVAVKNDLSTRNLNGESSSLCGKKRTCVRPCVKRLPKLEVCMSPKVLIRRLPSVERLCVLKNAETHVQKRGPGRPRKYPRKDEVVHNKKKVGRPKLSDDVPRVAKRPLKRKLQDADCQTDGKVVIALDNHSVTNGDVTNELLVLDNEPDVDVVGIDSPRPGGSSSLSPEEADSTRMKYSFNDESLEDPPLEIDVEGTDSIHGDELLEDDDLLNLTLSDDEDLSVLNNLNTNELSVAGNCDEQLNKDCISDCLTL